MQKSLLFCFLFFTFLKLFSLANLIGFNLTDSMPKGFYVNSAKEVERNDIVKFCLENADFTELAKKNKYLEEGICPNGLQPLLKIVAGLSGDEIEILDTGIQVKYPDNSIVFWEHSKIKNTDSKGNTLPISQLKNGIIPNGKALLLSTHKGSFDSRYFGLVDTKDLTVYKQLLTF